MVVGIPNVGKSSLINAMRTHTLGIKKKAVEAGARPGVTVRVQNRVRVLDKPPVYVIDTPGVLSPSHQNVEDAMKLAMCDLVLESHVNLYYLADYLLYWLNRTGDFSYLELLGIANSKTAEKVCLFQSFKNLQVFSARTLRLNPRSSRSHRRRQRLQNQISHRRKMGFWQSCQAFHSNLSQLEVQRFLLGSGDVDV